ncbi:hypothetical protein CDAR_476841 [Caerostris darwini]|uniref:Ycf1 n=1 Tax=Caerostris darwini TaxID=1538125 RepID=A0AAV4U534_9ARAC|nr:hypothetical protein CDAR_476841 [Caerostris darwini]
MAPNSKNLGSYCQGKDGEKEGKELLPFLILVKISEPEDFKNSQERDREKKVPPILSDGFPYKRRFLAVFFLIAHTSIRNGVYFGVRPDTKKDEIYFFKKRDLKIFPGITITNNHSNFAV